MFPLILRDLLADLFLDLLAEFRDLTLLDLRGCRILFLRVLLLRTGFLLLLVLRDFFADMDLLIILDSAIFFVLLFINND